MTSQFRINWFRDRQRRVREIDRLEDRTLDLLSPFWTHLESRLLRPTIEAVLEEDGVVRGWAGASIQQLTAPEQSFDPVDDVMIAGSSRWLVGGGLRTAEWLDADSRGLLVENMRVLLGYERSCEGVLVAVPFEGWGIDRTGGDRHYLEMVAYGSRRDAGLELYLERGFWFAGRHPTLRVAYLARLLRS